MRTREEIQTAIITDFQAEPELANANSTSRRAIWRLCTFVIASAILILEQIIEVFRAENEVKISKAIPATRSWIADRVFKFQYSATTPQVAKLKDFAVTYDIIDEALQLITRCSVVTTISNQVLIKVAKSEPPVQLSNLELASLQSYVNIFGIAGVNYICVSSGADLIYINADIYYNGQYSTVIQTSVTSAIIQFLASLPFNGQLKVSDIELAVRGVAGVNDILINDVKVRGASVPFIDGTFLIQNKTTISRIFPTISGYIIPETTTGSTLANSLTFIAN